MFWNFKNWFAEKKKNKMFKYVMLLIAIIIIAIAVDFTENKKAETGGKTSEAVSISEKQKKEDEKKDGFHIGIGHIVMLVLLVSAYGIDRAIVFRNNLEDDKKHSNFKEDE